MCNILKSLLIEKVTMSTIKVNIADATIADLQTKLGLNRSVAKVITEQKPCNMEKFLQIEGVDWDDIQSKEPNAELEFISANESMSADSKPSLPSPALPNQSSESIMGEFEKFGDFIKGEFNRFAQQMSGRMEIIQSEFSENKHDMNKFKSELKQDMNDFKSEIKEEMQHFQLTVESGNKKGIKVENINEINPQNSALGTSNGKDSYQSEHESVKGKNIQHSDSEVLSCKESVSSKPAHNDDKKDHKKDENDSQCKHAKTKTDHFAEYHQVYESKVVDGVYRPTNTTNSDPKSTGQGHSAPSSLMQNGINLAGEHNRNGVIVRDGVVVTKPNPTLVAKKAQVSSQKVSSQKAQIMQQPTSYSREGICETVEADFNVWNKKLAYLPKFDGTNWQAFISVFERNLSRHNLSDSLQLDLLESKLSGQAFQAYGQAHTSMDTYEELKKFLQSRFGTRITPQIRRNELFHMKQRTDETLIEFSSRVKSIAYEGFPEMNSKQRSELEVHAFLQGCQEKTFAERVILNTHPDLDSALNDMVKMVQNAHIFKSSNLEKTRVVRNLNNPEATEDTDRTQVARVWENKNSKVEENSSTGGMSLVLQEIMKNLALLNKNLESGSNVKNKDSDNVSSPNQANMAPKATPTPHFQGNWVPNRNYTNHSQPGNQVKLNSAGTSNRREFPNQRRQLYGDNRPQKQDAAASRGYNQRPSQGNYSQYNRQSTYPGNRNNQYSIQAVHTQGEGTDHIPEESDLIDSNEELYYNEAIFESTDPTREESKVEVQKASVESDELFPTDESLNY